MRKTPTHIFVERTPPHRIFPDEFDRLLNKNKESPIQTGLLPGVVMSGFVVFVERLWMKLQPHLPRERRTRASASSPGMV